MLHVDIPHAPVWTIPQNRACQIPTQDKASNFLQSLPSRIIYCLKSSTLQSYHLVVQVP